MKKLLSVSISAAVLAMGASSAMAATMGEVLEASGVSANGYLAGGYYYYDADAMGLNAFQNGVNGFDLQQAAITVAKKPDEGFGGVVNLTAGSNAKPIASVGTTADDFDVTQAYLQYATGGLTVMGGKFATLMGAEVIDSTVNTNISRSLSFFNAIAYTHTGVRATYAFNDTFSLTGGLNNGWDQQQDVNGGKTVELGVAWNPSAMFGLLAQAYTGEEPIDMVNAPNGFDSSRDLLNVVATVKPVEGLSLVFDVTSGKQDEATGYKSDAAKWMAVAGYVNYAFNEQWRISFRGEQFDDKDNYKLALGTNADGQKVTSATFTVGYAPVPNFEVRAEVRGDKADDEVFTKDGEATDTVKFAGVEGVFKF